MDKTQFIKDLYLNLAGRKADASGLSYWISLIDSGKTFAEIYTLFSNTEESRRHYVTQLYRGLFKREPDSEGLKYWASLLETNNSREDIYNAFMASSEYQQ